MSSIPEIADDAQHDKGVSPRAAKRLREAMERILAGRPQRTDGRLIKDNLWKEAGLSRATMNRAVRILAEWNTRVAACGGFTPREARKNDELTTLQTKLADKTANAPSSTIDSTRPLPRSPPSITTTPCYVKNSTHAADSSPCKSTAEGYFKSAAANARDRPRLSQTPVSPAVQQAGTSSGTWAAKRRCLDTPC